MTTNFDEDIKSGACQTLDPVDKDDLIAELKNRIAVLEHELRTKTDVTSGAILRQKQAEEALRDSEERFRLISTNSPDIISIQDADLRYEWVINPALGLTPADMTGKTDRDLLDPEQFAMISGLKRKVMDTGEPMHLQVPLTNYAGKTFWYDGSYIPRRGADGVVTGILCYFRDVTERKMAVEALEASEAKFRSLFESAGTAIFMADVATGEILDCNAKAEELVGRSRAEIIGLHQTRLHPGGHAELNWDTFKRYATGALTTNYETVVQHKDGRVIPVIINATPVEFNGRKVLIGYFLDITEQKLVENALRESEEKFRVLAETTSAIIALHQGHNLIFVNKATEEIIGYSKGKLLSMNFWEIFHPDTRELVRERGTSRMQAGTLLPSHYETRLITKTGREKWVYLSAGRVIYKGKPSVIITMVDITERKRAETVLELAKAQAELYLDLMGHDINNMHQIALGYLELARDSQPDGKLAAFLDKPIEVLNRSTQLIQNVRKLQKLNEGTLPVHEVNVYQVLVEVGWEFGEVSSKSIVLDPNGCESCRVMANELLHDVFANLVSNAIKHTGDSADISISLDKVTDNGGSYCRVCVEDHGPGIPDDFKGLVFNRMLKGTSKAKGMGLGLYLVKSLVSSFNGRVWVEDLVPGDHTKGARFIVLLPAIES